MADGDVTLHPAWRQAVATFLGADFKPGDVVPHAWLEASFGMAPLEEDAVLTAQEFRDRQFEWLANIDAFRAELLEQHQVCLVNVHGQGWRWAPPAEQTEIAQRRFAVEAKRTYRRAAMTLRHVRLEELSDDQRRENADAVAKLSQLRSMHKLLR